MLAAWATGQLGQLDRAIGYLKRAIAVNPSVAFYHRELARYQVDRRDWAAALASARQSLRFNPADLETRRFLVRSLDGLQQRDEARNELKILLGFDPPDARKLRRQ